MDHSIIYVSRRCKHSQELLILIHKNRDILNFRIIDIDKEPFPKSITTVPSMLIGEKILPGQELFKFLTYIINQKKGTNQNTNNLNNDNIERNNNQRESNQRESNQREGDMGRGNQRESNQRESNQREGDMGRGNQREGDMGRGNQREGDMGRGNQREGDMGGDNKTTDIVELDGFSNFGSNNGSNLGFSLLDDEDNTSDLDMPFEFLNSSDDRDDNSSPQMSGGGNDFKSEKKNMFDNDYEDMMKSRSLVDQKSENPMNMRTF